MFDNLHLIFTKHRFPLTPENPIFEIESPNSEESAEYIHALTSLTSCSYCIDGESYISPFHLPSADVLQKNQLFYIKAFSIIHSCEQYFTRRGNEDSYLLLFTYEGKGMLEYEGQRYTLSKGDGFLIDCRKPHYYKAIGSHWHHADLHFNGAQSETFYNIFREHANFFFSQPTNGLFQKQLEELVETYEGLSLYKDLLVSSKLNTLLTTLLTSSDFYQQSIQSIPENLNYLVKYIQNFYHQHLTLDFLSNFSGISKPHLIRLFNKYLVYCIIDI